MHSRDYRSAISGVALIMFGVWFAWYAISNYGRGTLSKVGEGMFPAGLGILLAVIGIFIALNAIFQQSAKSELSLRPPLLVFLGIANFALLVKPFGMAPAISSLVVLSCLANTQERKSSLLGMVAMCGVLSLLCYLIFNLGLGLLIPMFDFPN